MKLKMQRIFSRFVIFLLSLMVFVPAPVYAQDNPIDIDSATGGIVASDSEYKFYCRIPVEVAFENSNTSLPSNVTVRVIATLKAIAGSPMPANSNDVDGVQTAEIVLNGAGKTSFDLIEYTEPGDYLYELTYRLETNSSRVSIRGRSSYFIRVAVRNKEDGFLTGAMLVYPDQENAEQAVEDAKLSDTKLTLRYTRPTTPTDPDDPDDPTNPSFPNLPDTNKPNTSNPGNNTNVNNPSINLPNTSNPGTTTNNTTTTSTPNITKPNTATETNLMTYLIGIVVSGGLMIFFLLLARRKAEEN